MISWVLYIISTTALGCLFASRRKIFSKWTFTFVMVLFLTPAQISLTDSTIAPALYIFFYNLLFETELSLRPLRPLVLTTPIILFGYILVEVIRRKFF